MSQQLYKVKSVRKGQYVTVFSLKIGSSVFVGDHTLALLLPWWWFSLMIFSGRQEKKEEVSGCVVGRAPHWMLTCEAGTDKIANPVNEHILWVGQMGDETTTTEGFPSCALDTVPHDPAMFRQYPVTSHFHRAALGLAGLLFVLAKGQQFTAIFCGWCCWQPDRVPAIMI